MRTVVPMSTLPSSGCSSPAMSRSRVDFPTPLWPTMPMRSSRSTP